MTNLLKYISALVGWAKSFAHQHNSTQLLFLAALTLLLALPALADDDAGDWGDIYDSYNSAQYGNPVSEREVEDAIKTIKRYKGDKQDKKKDKKAKEGGVSTGENIQAPPEMMMPQTPDAAGLLFLLPMNVSLGENTIEKGFYLIESADKDNSHFIRLTRGEGHVVADIQASATNIDRIQRIGGGKTSISSEMTENGLLKITLIDTKYILEAYLWVQ